jgi:hypothetical protein
VIQRVAQLVAHVFRVHEVEGSSPSTLTEGVVVCSADPTRLNTRNAQVAERQLRRPVEPLALAPTGVRVPPCALKRKRLRRKFQRRNARLQIGKRQVRSLRGALNDRPCGRVARRGPATPAHAGSTPAMVSVAVAQSGRAPGCDPGRCGFESRRSP